MIDFCSDPSPTPTSLQAASAWIETIGKQWDERLQRLKNLVEDDSF